MKLPNEFKLIDGTLEELNTIISNPDFVGLIRDLPEELYHKCKGLSRSWIVEAKDNLSNFLEYPSRERKETPAMRFGTATHCAVLEPEKFQELYVAEPAKEDYEGLLESSDQLKDHLKKFVSSEKEQEELLKLEEKLSKKEQESIDVAGNLDKAIKDLPKSLDKEKFSTKKAMDEEVKKQTGPLKEQLKELKEKFKIEISDIKEAIKTKKADISKIEALFKMTKQKLIEEIRKHDQEVNIWDEIMSNFIAQSKGKRIVSQNDLKTLYKVLANAKRREALQLLLSSGIPEVTIFWTDKETGLLLKARIDLLTITTNRIVPSDIKTCLNAQELAFAKDAGNKNYHIQEAMYVEGLNIVLSPILPNQIEDFVFIACEKERGCEINEVVLGPASKEKARSDFRKCLNRIKSYYDSLNSGTPIYTGYDQGFKSAEMPIYQIA